MLQGKGILFVISAPSGAGKNSLLHEVLANNDQLKLAVSHTTRLPRPGESEGKSYYFVDEDDFKHLVEEENFIEYAKVHGHYYGTSKQEIQGKLDNGQSLLLEIDVQGAKQIKEKFPDAVLIYILPSFDRPIKTLRERLQLRKTNHPLDIETRLCNAQQELKQAANYDYVVVNDDFNTAKADLQCIFRVQTLTVERNKEILKKILADLPA
jgi:guanylate kinase